jgi:hypothetical protein
LPIALHLKAVGVEMVGETLVDDEDLEEVRLFESSTDGKDAKVLDLMHLDKVWVLHL